MKDKVAALLQEHKVDEAIDLIYSFKADGGRMDDTLYYLLGNAWRKKGNWQMAINNYLEAVRLNPDSPAAGALEIANNILDYYNKDLYNP
ncbi:MAG: tetratricopeptide repeat protein [Bacteroidales bacterium]|nr:tetratricopeptide repeat protein [Bacteroidales bacterium]